MNRYIASRLFLLLLIPLHCSASCKCDAPEQGAQGEPGESNFVSAFASDYTYERGFFTDEPIPFELVNANVNVIHIPGTIITGSSLEIVTPGHYFLFFGASNLSEGPAQLALYVNNVQVPGTIFYLVGFPGGLTNLGSIVIPLQAGDVIQMRSVGTLVLDTDFFTETLSVTAQINLIRLGPL